MRILFDSKSLTHKTPFGTLTPEDKCTLNLYIPASVKASRVQCLLQKEDGTPFREVEMRCRDAQGDYDIFRCEFTLETPDLYFYYFRVTCPTGPFRLFKQGDGTNMEAGDLWQVSCVPTDFITPDWAMGATFYQIYPDRFYKKGSCDLTGKLEPYTVHKSWSEEVGWQPDSQGRILNNDFYGGNFQGITAKMDYIASLGTTILYLNPIGKAFSNHRYDTGDYKTPDPMLGTEADFKALCDAAHARGIKVILDGVYSHTGADSLYFNREGSFAGPGAYQSKRSPYYSWYQFTAWPDKYKSWWDFDTLPTVNKMDPAFIEYIITGQDSVLAHWLKLGADGFRLDVVDELPEPFLALLKQQLRKLRPDALLLGEVWEDASNKKAYGIRRRYFVDAELDSVMNYPFRTAILKFVRGEDTGEGFRDAVMTIQENYPPQVLHCNMNPLGTHDTPRILTALVDDFDGTRAEKVKRHLSPQQRQEATKKLRMASFLQFMLPGSPSTYYGDEAGLEGYKDPFNRRTYPWGKEDADLLAHYRSLGALRRQEKVLRTGMAEFIESKEGRLHFRRVLGEEALDIYCNLSAAPWAIGQGQVLLGGYLDRVSESGTVVGVGGFCVVRKENGR